MIDELITQVHQRKVSDPYDLTVEWEVSVVLVGGGIGTGRGKTRWIAEARAIASLIEGDFTDTSPKVVR